MQELKNILNFNSLKSFKLQELKSKGNCNNIKLIIQTLRVIIINN